jgi:RNA polymerase sigma factor (sigma-70 family)
MRPFAPTIAPPAYDLDMTKLEDEQLVVLAQECGYRPARDELICRCLGLARRLVGHYASGNGLQQADSQDAEQDAVLWILEALGRYRTSESVRPGGCHFRSFLHRVLASRLVDFFRHLRLRNHFPPVGRGVACLGQDSHHLHDEGDPAPDVSGLPHDPEEGEMQACLHQELDQLVQADRRLWDLLAAGTPLRQVAAALGISYDAAKRRRRKLLARLKSSLTRFQPPGP